MLDLLLASSQRPSVSLNPLDKSASVSLSNNNTRATMANGGGVRADAGHATGKWYFEVRVIQIETGASPLIGYANPITLLDEPWNDLGGGVLFNTQVIYYHNLRATYGTGYGAGDIIGVAVDLDNHVVTFYKNDLSFGVSPLPFDLLLGQTFFPFVGSPNAGGQPSIVDIQFRKLLTYAPPTGFLAW